MSRPGRGAAWGSLLLGLASVAVLPLAVYLTRFSERYELLHAGLAIPLGSALGLASITLAGRARRRTLVLLDRGSGARLARVGRVVGFVGLCMALAALVSLGVYALLEYVGSRD